MGGAPGDDPRRAPSLPPSRPVARERLCGRDGAMGATGKVDNGRGDLYTMVQSNYNVSGSVSHDSRPGFHFWTETLPMSKRSFRAATLALAGILIGLGGCAESPSAPAAKGAGAYQVLQVAAGARMDAFGSASAVIGPEGGVVSAPGGATLSFPAGALAEPTTISLAPVAGVVGVEVQPHGLTFAAGYEPTLTLPYVGANVAGLSRLSVVYVDGGAITEVLSTSVSTGAQTLTARLPHFSIYAGAGY